MSASGTNRIEPRPDATPFATQASLYRESTGSIMPLHGGEVPLLKQVAILTLHWYGEKNWIDISTLLKVHPDIARAICVRAKESAADPNNFDDVLQHLENLGRPKSKDIDQYRNLQKEQRPAIVGNRTSNKAQVSIGPEELEILEQLSQNEGESQHEDQHRTRHPTAVKHKVSNATNASTESKELEILEKDLFLVGNGIVSCRGSLEGVTMMRDMDWR